MPTKRKSKIATLQLVSAKDECQRSCVEVAERILERAKAGEIYNIVAICEMPEDSYWRIASQNENEFARLGKIEMIKQYIVMRMSPIAPPTDDDI